jgi:hypothetical protein
MTAFVLVLVFLQGFCLASAIWTSYGESKFKDKWFE